MGQVVLDSQTRGELMNSESRPLSVCGWAILHRIAGGDTDDLGRLVSYIRDPEDVDQGERWQFLRLAENDAWTAVELLLLRKLIEKRFSEGTLDAWVQVTPLGQEIHEGLTSFFDSYRTVEFPEEPTSFGVFAFQELCAARLAGELHAELRDPAGTAEEIIARLGARLNDRFPAFVKAIRNPGLDLPGMAWGILDWRIRMNFETLVALPTCRTPPPNPGLEDLAVLLINCPTTVMELLCDVFSDGEFARRTRVAKAGTLRSADAGCGTGADVPSILNRVIPIRASTLAEASAEADRVRRTENTLVALHSLWAWYTALPLDQRKALGDFRSKHDLWIAARFLYRLR
jgi:hypothetical protein